MRKLEKNLKFLYKLVNFHFDEDETILKIPSDI